MCTRSMQVIPGLLRRLHAMEGEKQRTHIEEELGEIDMELNVPVSVEIIGKIINE